MAALTLEAEITELSPGGDGVAIVPIAGERRAVFVGGVATGEQVVLEVDARQRPARGRIVRILRSSADRVPPPCAHVDRCGGCDWMHLAPSAQAREHAAIVGRLLGVTIPERAIHAAPRSLGYRTRARVHVEAKRGRVHVGMFGRRSHDPTVVDTCVVLDPILDQVRAALAGWLEGARGTGEAHLALGMPGPIRHAVVDLRFRGELPGAVFGRFEAAVMSSAPALLGGVRIFAGDVSRPATIGDPTPAITGADGEPLVLPPGGFSQATEEGNGQLAQHVLAQVRTLAGGPCVELYAGAGNLTVLLAKQREVIAVESDGPAALAAKANLVRRGLEAKLVTGDAATFAIPRPTRLVVLDPPREGARAVAEALALRVRQAGASARKTAPAIVYVSCDPPTLTRDVRILVDGGYAIGPVDTFEMFPQTSHVETVVVLTPA